jgi:hypothetical protein
MIKRAPQSSCAVAAQRAIGFIGLCFRLAILSAPPAHAEQEIVTAQEAVQPVTLTGFTR